MVSPSHSFAVLVPPPPPILSKGVKIKLYFIKGKKVHLTYRSLLQNVIKSPVEVDLEKKFYAWLGLTKLKMNLIKFT